MKCLQCGQEFEGRADKATCSPKCQKARQRAKVDNKVDTAKVDTLPPGVVWESEPGASKKIAERLEPCTHLHCAAAKARGVNTVLHQHRPSHELGPREVNRVSLPGDVDYDKGVG